MIFVGYTLPTFHFSFDPKLSTISYMCTDQFSFGCVCSVSNCSHGSLFYRKWFKRNRRNDDIVDKDLLYNLTFVSFSCLSYTIQYLVMMLIKLFWVLFYNAGITFVGGWIWHSLIFMVPMALLTKRQGRMVCDDGAYHQMERIWTDMRMLSVLSADGAMPLPK